MRSLSGPWQMKLKPFGYITTAGRGAGRDMQKHIKTLGIGEFTGLMLRVGTVSIRLNNTATSWLDPILPLPLLLLLILSQVREVATVNVYTKRRDNTSNCVAPDSHTLTYLFNARSSTSLKPRPGQVHNSEQDRPLGNAPGRAPAAQTEAKETQLFSCLGSTDGIRSHAHFSGKIIQRGECFAPHAN